MARPRVKCEICGYKANTAQGLKTHKTRLHSSGKYESELKARNSALEAENDRLRSRLRDIRKLAAR